MGKVHTTRNFIASRLTRANLMSDLFSGLEIIVNRMAKSTVRSNKFHNKNAAMPKQVDDAIEWLKNGTSKRPECRASCSASFDYLSFAYVRPKLSWMAGQAESRSSIKLHSRLSRQPVLPCPAPRRWFIPRAKHVIRSRLSESRQRHPTWFVMMNRHQRSDYDDLTWMTVNSVRHSMLIRLFQQSTWP